MLSASLPLSLPASPLQLTEGGGHDLYMKSPENPRGNERLCESGRKVGGGCQKEEEKPPPSLAAGGLNWARGRLGGVARRGRGQMHKANQERRWGSGSETPAGELRGLALWLLGTEEGIGSKRGGKGGWKRRGGDPEVEGREEAPNRASGRRTWHSRPSAFPQSALPPWGHSPWWLTQGFQLTALRTRGP